MEMTIQIPSEIEGPLAAEAEKNGVDPAGFIQNLLGSRLRSETEAPSLTNREAELLQEVDTGFSQAEMERYVNLVEKRHDEAISEEELAELQSTTRELERLNAKRASALSELAELRGVDLSTVMEQLGIEPPDVL